MKTSPLKTIVGLKKQKDFRSQNKRYEDEESFVIMKPREGESENKQSKIDDVFKK